jgi:NAD(P)-dependent dehydrogenase (short-subunit alcohol dehydrogenase family)
VSELLKGTSIYVVGASTTINWAVAKELATGLGYVFLFHLLIL